jgi:hypothetical protein
MINPSISYKEMYKGVMPPLSTGIRDRAISNFRTRANISGDMMGNSALYNKSYRNLLQDLVSDLGLRKGLGRFYDNFLTSSGVAYTRNLPHLPKTSGNFYTQSKLGPIRAKRDPKNIKSTMVHEGDHFYMDNNIKMPSQQRYALADLSKRNTYQGSPIQKLYKKLFGKNTKSFKAEKDYYQGVGEINARVMQMRYEMGMMPGDKLSKPGLEMYMKNNPDLHGMKKWLNVDESGKFNTDDFLNYFNNYYEEGGEENNPEPTLVTPGTNEYRKAYQDNTLTTYNPEDNSYHFPMLDEIEVTDNLPSTPKALRNWSRTHDPIAYATREATSEAAPYVLGMISPALVGASIPIATAIGTSAPVTAGVGLLDDAAMGLYNSPYVGGAVRNAWNYNPTKIPGLTVGNITNAGFAGHGAVNIGPNTGELIEDPSLSNAGNVGMNVLEMSPFFGPTANAIKGGFGVLKNTFKTTGSNASYIDEFLLSEKQLAGIKDNLPGYGKNVSKSNTNPTTAIQNKIKEVNSGYSKVLNEWSSAKGRNKLSEIIRDYLTNPYTYNRLNVKPIYKKADDVPQELIDDAIEKFLGAQRNLKVEFIDEIGAAGWGGKTGDPYPFLQLHPELSGNMLDQVIRHEMGHILQGLPAHVNLKKYDPSKYQKLYEKWPVSDYGVIPPHRYQGVGIVDELGGTKNPMGMTYGRESLAHNIGLTHNQLQMDKDLIAGLKLRPEYQNVLERDIPKDINFIRGLSLDNVNDRAKGLFQLNPLGAGKYFTSGSGKVFGASREPTPFLTELRTAMKNTGYIDDIHQPVTQKDILNFYKNYYNAPSSTLGGSRAIPDIRLLEIMEPSLSNFNFLAKTMNKLPATIPLVGAGLMGSDKAGPGYQPGGETDYTPQTQQPLELKDVKDGEVNTEGLTPYVNYNIPYDVDFHETDVPDYIKLRQSIAESTLDPEAVSEAGATGLTQIMPITLKHYEERTGDTSIDLTNYQDAMKVQDWLMQDLYNADWINKPNQSEMVRMAKTLSAYNWGRTAFNEFINRQKDNKVDIYGDRMPWIQNLPKETRDYLSKILWDNHPQMTIDYKHVMDRPEKYGAYFDAYNFDYKKGGEQKRQQRLWKEYKKYTKGDKVSPIVMNELEELGIIKSHQIQPNKYYKGKKDNQFSYIDDGGEIAFADQYILDNLDLAKVSRGAESPITLKQQIGFYQDHINSIYDGTKNFKKSKALFDKINRLYLLDAKKDKKHVLSYMKSLPEFQGDEGSSEVNTDDTETDNTYTVFQEPNMDISAPVDNTNVNVNLNIPSATEVQNPYDIFNADNRNYDILTGEPYKVSTQEDPIYYDDTNRNLDAIVYYTPRNERETFFTSDSERMTPYLDETYGAGNYKVVELPHQAYQPRYTELSDLMYNHPAMLEFEQSRDAIKEKYNPQFDIINDELNDLADQLGAEHDKDSDNFKRLKKLYEAKNQEIFDLEDIYTKERRDYRDNFYDNLETTHPDLFEIRKEYQDKYTGENRLNKYVPAKNIADQYFGDIKNLHREGKIFFMQHGDSRIGPLTLTETYRDENRQTPGVIDTFGEILLPESQGGWLADDNQVVCYAGMCGGVEEMRALTEASGVTTKAQTGTWSGYQGPNVFPGDNIESQFFNTNQEGIINPNFDGGAYVTHVLNDGILTSETTGNDYRGVSADGTTNNALPPIPSGRNTVDSPWRERRLMNRTLRPLRESGESIPNPAYESMREAEAGYRREAAERQYQPGGENRFIGYDKNMAIQDRDVINTLREEGYTPEDNSLTYQHPGFEQTTKDLGVYENFYENPSALNFIGRNIVPAFHQAYLMATDPLVRPIHAIRGGNFFGNNLTDQFQGVEEKQVNEKGQRISRNMPDWTSWEERGSLLNEDYEAEDLVLDAAALINPIPDIVHGVEEAAEGDLVSGAMYTLFGILPGTASPIVNKLRPKVGALMDILRTGKPYKENLKARTLANEILDAAKNPDKKELNNLTKQHFRSILEVDPEAAITKQVEVDINKLNEFETQSEKFIREEILKTNEIPKRIPYVTIDDATTTIHGMGSGPQPSSYYWGRNFNESEKNKIKTHFFDLARKENLFEPKLLSERQILIDESWVYDPVSKRMVNRDWYNYKGNRSNLQRDRVDDETFANFLERIDDRSYYPKEGVDAIQQGRQWENFVGYDRLAINRFLHNLKRHGINRISGKEFKEMFPQGVYHGSPYKFDEPKISVGEGLTTGKPNQSQPGFYGTTNPYYAENYMDWETTGIPYGQHKRFGVSGTEYADINIPYLPENRTLYKMEIADDAVIQLNMGGLEHPETFSDLANEGVDIVFGGNQTSSVGADELLFLNKKGIHSFNAIEPKAFGTSEIDNVIQFNNEVYNIMKQEGLDFRKAFLKAAETLNWSPGITRNVTPLPAGPINAPWNVSPNVTHVRMAQDYPLTQPGVNIADIPADRLNYDKRLMNAPGFMRSRGWSVDNEELLKQNDLNWLLEREHGWWNDGGEYVNMKRKGGQVNNLRQFTH